MNKMLLVACLAALVLAACGGKATTSASDENAPLATVPADYGGLTNPLGPEAAQQGAQVFQANCAMCHGPAGRGDGPAGQALNPPPRNLAQIQAEAGDDFLFWRIHDGKPGTSMVAWKGILTDEQIWQTVAFIRTLK